MQPTWLPRLLPKAVFFRSTTQQTHNPYRRRIEANIGCEELFSEQHRFATHQRNASKAEKDGLHLAGVRLLISRSFYPRRKELTRANSCSKIVTRDFNCSQLGLCSMHKKDSESTHDAKTNTTDLHKIAFRLQLVCQTWPEVSNRDNKT